VQRRILVTGLFGLVHGFGFSYGLQENLQYAGGHLVASLAAFNVGIELGQLAVLAVMLPALALVQRHVVTGRVGTIVISAVVAHTAWHWMTERGDVLLKAEWVPPSAQQWTVLAVCIAGLAIAAGIVRALIGRWQLAPGKATPVARTAAGD